MTLPTRNEAEILLCKCVTDSYQRLHAKMVGQAMTGYAQKFGENEELWWLTGYLHDLDYGQYPTKHPGPALDWFKEWNYPTELIHAVEAHADGFNGFITKPKTLLAKTLLACDEICGIFYAYQKLNPIPFGEMKVSSIKKRLQTEKFTPGISRPHIYRAIDALGISPEEHIKTIITALSKTDEENK